MDFERDRITFAPISKGNMAAIIPGLFVTVGIGALALVSYLFILPDAKPSRPFGMVAWGLV
jgi:hypothetical protein